MVEHLSDNEADISESPSDLTFKSYIETIEPLNEAKSRYAKLESSYFDNLPTSQRRYETALSYAKLEVKFEVLDNLIAEGAEVSLISKAMGMTKEKVQEVIARTERENQRHKEMNDWLNSL